MLQVYQTVIHNCERLYSFYIFLKILAIFPVFFNTSLYCVLYIRICASQPFSRISPLPSSFSLLVITSLLCISTTDFLFLFSNSATRVLNRHPSCSKYRGGDDQNPISHCPSVEIQTQQWCSHDVAPSRLHVQMPLGTLEREGGILNLPPRVDLMLCICSLACL